MFSDVTLFLFTGRVGGVGWGFRVHLVQVRSPSRTIPIWERVEVRYILSRSFLYESCLGEGRLVRVTRVPTPPPRTSPELTGGGDSSPGQGKPLLPARSGLA